MGAQNLINLDNLHDICGGEDIYVKEIIDLFLKQAPEMVDEIEKAFLENNKEMLIKKAHKLKSSSCIFGIEKLTELLLIIELDGMNKLSRKDKKAIIKEIRDTAETSCAQLMKERKKYS